MSSWNEFQKANGGKGMSRSEMSAAYQASKASGGGGGGGSSRSSSSYSSPSYSAPSYSAPSYSAHSYSTPSYSRPSPPPAPAASRGPSAWNEFQRSLAGQGLSQSDMAALYRSLNSGSSSTPSPAPTRQCNSAAARSTTSSSSSSPWNEYQREHAGQGLTRAEMSSGYRSQQAAMSSSAASATSAEAKRAAAAEAASKRAAAAATVARTAAKPKATVPAASAVKPQTSTGPLSWNDFQRQQAGKGYSKRQISLLFKEHKATTSGASTLASSSATTTTAARSTARATASSAGSATSTTTKPARRANAFNEFQKQYKKDHPNEKLPAAQLAKLYRQQQQRENHVSHNERLVDELFGETGLDHRGLEANAPSNAFIESDQQAVVGQRQLIEDMMLEMTKQMEELRQQSAPQEELDEVARAVHDLEAEEGNLNRKAFVDAHELELVLAMSKENPTAHAKYLSSLHQCEAIDASRLKLTMDDESRIGSGGCGVVYTAVLDDETPVAVKVVDGVNTKSKARFEQEMLAMMKASAHENVLRVLGYSVFTDTNARQSFGIVMELMSGGDLAYVMHRDENVTLTEKDLLKKLVQVIKAIEYIHSQGITHRDIKPHNVLLSGDLQTAKLADFGLAGFKNTTLSTRQSQVGSTTGVMGLTPTYAAPEVINGKIAFRDTDGWKKSDVFSFTVLLTEAVMREQPWEFEAPQFIMTSVSVEHERPFKEDELKLSSTTATTKLRALVRDGWHQDPSKRPTATEVRERLEKIVAAVEAASATASKGGALSSAGSSPRGVDAVGTANPYSYLYPERRANRTTGHTVVYNGDAFYDAE